MIRCIKTTNLEVHYKRTDGGNDIDNAVVLCPHCYATITGNGAHGNTPVSFSSGVKEQALRKANRRCECRSDIISCH